MELLDEDFEHNLGYFNAGSDQYLMYYPLARGLWGWFSFYVNSMELEDGYCVNVSVEDGSSWRSERCWYVLQDLEDGTGYNIENVKEDIEFAIPSISSLFLPRMVNYLLHLTQMSVEPTLHIPIRKEF